MEGGGWSGDGGDFEQGKKGEVIGQREEKEELKMNDRKGGVEYWIMDMVACYLGVIQRSEAIIWRDRKWTSASNRTLVVWICVVVGSLTTQ